MPTATTPFYRVVPKISALEGTYHGLTRYSIVPKTQSMQEGPMVEYPPVHAFFRSSVLYHIEYWCL